MNEWSFSAVFFTFFFIQCMIPTKKYEFMTSNFFPVHVCQKIRKCGKFENIYTSKLLIMKATHPERSRPDRTRLGRTRLGRSCLCRQRLVALKNLLKVHFCNGNFNQMLILALLLILGKDSHSGKSMKNYFQTFSWIPLSNITVHAPIHDLVNTSFLRSWHEEFAIWCKKCQKLFKKAQWCKIFINLILHNYN